jgi:hypothetical protein
MNDCHQIFTFLPPTENLWHLAHAGIVTAAVFADARHIVEEITLLKRLLKTRVNGATPAAAAADPTE